MASPSSQLTMTLEEHIESRDLVTPYLWTIVCAGGLIYILATARLDLKIVDLKLGVLVVITALLSSRMTIKIPQFGSYISVSDTFIFLTLLLYGCEAAILMAATEALLSSIRRNAIQRLATLRRSVLADGKRFYEASLTGVRGLAGDALADPQRHGLAHMMTGMTGS